MALIVVDPALRAAHQEIHAQTDRGAAIIAGGILDQLLKKALRKRLILNAELQKDLFGQNGPLSTFSNKIDAAFCVGLIPKKMRTDLHLVRKVRNRFAHKINPLTFEDEEISNWCGEVSAPKEITGSRNRYLFVAFGASAVLMVLTRVELRLVSMNTQPSMRSLVIDATDAVLTEFLDLIKSNKS